MNPVKIEDETLKMIGLLSKTDLDKFVELYRGFGIECKVVDVEIPENRRLSVDVSSADKKIKVIVLDNPSNSALSTDTVTYSDKIVGNAYTKLVFTKEGKFIEQGIWE